MHAHFALIDWLILGCYLVFLLVVGFWPRRQSNETYLIADRNLALPLFVATLVATWYGGILGAGEFSYSYGLVAWTTNGFPYYFFAIVFALFLAARVRKASIHSYTIPDMLEREYDRKTALLGAFFAFVYASPSSYILMTGLLLKILFGWHLLFAMVVGTIFSIVYVYRGGFLSDVRVNTLQFFLMFTGFVIITWMCLARYGGIHALFVPGALPKDHLLWLGDPRQGEGLGYVIVWFFIALVTITDPGFHQRCYAARTPRTAVVGILLAVVCWFSFDFMTNVTGLFARMLCPNLADPRMAYPALAQKILPAGLKGLFYLGMLAPVMASTISYTFISGVTIGRDFIWRMSTHKNERKLPQYTAFGLVSSALLAIWIALLVPSVVQQWYAFGNVFVPAMLLPILGAYAPDQRWKAPANFTFVSMLLGVVVSLGCLVYGWTHGGVNNPNFPFGWQPMYSGLLVCVVPYVSGIVWQQHHIHSS